MSFEKIKDEKVVALVEAAQDCGHYTSSEDLEKKLEYLDFCCGELLSFVADEALLRQEGLKAYLKTITWHSVLKGHRQDGPGKSRS
jgi:hypothetical protein